LWQREPILTRPTGDGRRSAARPACHDRGLSAFLTYRGVDALAELIVGLFKTEVIP
jgi:hypothetical protein